MNQTNADIPNDIYTPLAKAEHAKWTYVSLTCSLFYFMPVLSIDLQFNSLDYFVLFAIYFVFLGLFFAAAKHCGTKAQLPIAGIIIISAVGSYCYPGTSSLFGYAAFFTGYYFAARKALFIMAANLASQLLAAYFFDLFIFYFLGVSLTISLMLFVFGIFTRKETLNRILKAKQNQYIEDLAAIAERERIARDMHDLLGHSLSSLALKSELAEKLLNKGKSKAAQTEIQQVAQLARQTLSEVRQAVTGLNKQSLKSAINELTGELTNLGYETQHNVLIPALSAKTESTLSMLCKEWVTNILRHSSGNKVFLEISQINEEVRLTIKDNGKVNKISPGNGINGMKSRVAELKGNLNIDIEDGVSLQVCLPHKGLSTE